MNRTFLAILVAAIAALSVTFATTSISFADGNDDVTGAEIPPGQLTRKGISGVVSSISGSSVGVATRFGIITVAINSSTRITFQGGGDGESDGPTTIRVGDRVGVQLNRSPVDPNAPPPTEEEEEEDGGGTSTTTTTTLDTGSATTTDGTLPDDGDDSDGGDGSDTGDDNDGSATSTDEFDETDEERTAKIKSRFNFENLTVIRTVTATRIKVVPNKAATKHVRGLVTGKANGKFQLICGSGDTSGDDSGSSDSSSDGSTGDDGSATSTDSNLDEQDVDIDGDIDAEVGDEIILIADANGETGDGGCPTKAKGGQNSDRIAERLVRLAERTAARDSRLSDKLADLEAKRAERQEARNDKTRGKASPEGKGKIDGARGKPVGDDAVPRGGKKNDTGKPPKDDTGKPPKDDQPGGGNNNNSPGGGGGSGGGPPDDKDKTKGPKDK